MARVASTKKVKKEWYEIECVEDPFKGIRLGESPAKEIEMLIGRKVELPLEFVNPDYKTKNLYWIKFKICDINKTEKKGLAKVEEIFLSRRYYLSLAKPGTKKIDGVLKVKTSDDRNIIVKFIVIAVGSPKRRQRRDIRNIAMKEIENIVGSMKKEELVDKILKREVQQKLREACKKVYPIQIVETYRVIDESIKCAE